MRLFMLRHGQTDKNLQRLMIGHYDEDINATGVAQAEEAREEIKKINYDVIMASPLMRARHTADIVNCKNLPVIYDDRLMEREMGFLTNNARHVDIDRRDFWSLYPTADYRDAEPMRTMLERVGDFYEDIRKKYPDKTVLAVTHDGVVRTLHGYLYGIPESGSLLDGNIKNCEVREITEPRREAV